VPDARYSYEDAGFNGFMRRTINSNPTENSLKGVGVGRRGQPQTLDFDSLHTGGSIGDKFTAGRVVVDGSNGAIKIMDTDGNEVVRLGQMEG